jgi:hypothetical protein
VTVQVDIRLVDRGESPQIVFHRFPLDDGLVMRILIASSIGDIDSVARLLRGVADRLECGALASRTGTGPDADVAQIPADLHQTS